MNCTEFWCRLPKTNSTNGTVVSPFLGDKRGLVNYADAIVRTLQTVLTLAAISVFVRWFLKRGTHHSAFTAYLVSVVAGEFCYVLYNVLYIIQIYLGHWPSGEYGCAFALFTFYTGGIVVLYGELLIAVTRIWALCAPHHYRTHHTKRLARLFCVTVWLSAFALIVPLIVFYAGNRSRKSGVCRVENSSYPQYALAFRAIYNLPVFLIPGIYSFLFIRQRARFSLAQRRTTESARTMTRKRHTGAGVSVGVTDSVDATRAGQTGRVMPRVASRRSRSLKHLAVLAWVALNVSVLWAPLIIYQLLMSIAPALVPLNMTVWTCLTTWNLCSCCCVPLIFVFTAMRS